MGAKQEIGIRTKVIISTFLFVMLVDLVAGIFLERQLVRSVSERMGEDLRSHARGARELMLSIETPWTEGAVDGAADAYGDAIGARVTVISPDGVVLGDSERTVEQLKGMSNHADRPEVVEARRLGEAVSTRRSATLEQDLVYAAAAVPVAAAAVGGATTPLTGATVRVAMPLREVDAAVASLRALLLIAGLMAVALASFVAFFVSDRVVETLRGLVERTRSAGDGPEAGGSIAGLTRSLERTVQTLAHERNRFRAVLESMDDGVLAIDRDYNITAANPAARKMLSLRDDPEGSILIKAVALPKIEVLAAAALAGQPSSSEFTLYSTPPRQIMVSARPQDGDEAGEVAGAVLVLHDVSEVRRLETVRQDFVANVSHELRTPVAVIRANAETLLDGAVDDPEKARRFLKPIGRNAERLGQLIADLLDISRIDRDKFELKSEAVDLHAVARTVVETNLRALADRTPNITLLIPEGTVVQADRGALEQVLSNLVENAVKYGPEAGHVELSVKVRGAQLRVEVSDEGPGIAQEHRPRVFERFYRVDPGRSRDMGGTGLGLAIVKNLVEAMHGEAGVELRHPTGSVFWVSLPMPDVSEPEPDAHEASV